LHNKKHQHPLKKQNGLTLIELVVVLTILGIVSAGIASFVRASIQNVVLVTDRDKLLSASRFSIERLSRELVNALPGSVRVARENTFHCLQFVPIKLVSAYTRLPDDDNSSVQIVRPIAAAGEDVTITANTDFVTVYPLIESDVYGSATGTFAKRKAITSVNDHADPQKANLLELAVSGFYPEASPADRAYIVDRAVSFCLVPDVVNGGRLVRFESEILPAAPDSIPASAVTIAEQLVNNILVTSDEPFRILQPSRQRNAVAQIRLRFSQNNEQITLQQEVHIPNAP